LGSLLLALLYKYSLFLV